MPSSDWKGDDAGAVAQTANAGIAARDIVVVNKVDLAPVEATGVVPLSAKSGAGLPELLARIETLGRGADGGGRRRAAAHPRASSRGADGMRRHSLGRALAAPEIALAAEDLRLAMRALGRITGTVRIDELLDVIFRDFCIGK